MANGKTYVTRSSTLAALDKSGDASSVSDKSSCSSSDGISVTASVSLRNDIDRANKLISFLKAYSPGKQNKKKKSKNSFLKNGTPEISHNEKNFECLDLLSSMTSRILDELDALKRNSASFGDDHQFKDCSSSIGKPQKTYAEAVSGQVSKVNNSSPITKNVKKLDNKIDEIEQNSLSNYASIQGVAVDTLIETTTDNNSRYNLAAIKSAVVSEFKSFMPDEIDESEITSIAVIGREKKLLKVKFSSVTLKNNILHGARLTKPANFYVNEYLTKKRSTLLYNLRCLRKKYDQISAVYSKNGNVYYKIGSEAINKHHLVSDIVELQALEDGFKTAPQ